MIIGYGICCNTYGALWDVKSKSILFDDNGEWTINIFKVLSDMNLLTNFELAGPGIDDLVEEAYLCYQREMISRKRSNLYC